MPASRSSAVPAVPPIARNHTRPRPATHQVRHGVLRDCICGEPLGIQRGDALHVEIGGKCGTHLVLRGEVWVLCGACKRTRTLNTCPPARKVTSAQGAPP